MHVVNTQMGPWSSNGKWQHNGKQVSAKQHSSALPARAINHLRAGILVHR